MAKKSKDDTKKETAKIEHISKQVELVFRNLNHALDVLKASISVVVNWQEDMNNIVKLLEDTGNDRVNLEFIKSKLEKLSIDHEREASKLVLEVETP